jgi:hypothetical protein
MHIKYLLQSISSVGVQVGFKSTHRLPVKEFILFNKSLELLLDACQFVLSELVVIELHLGVHQMLEVSLLLREEEE